ncbi:MAG: hypothetical protein HY437_00460 [Candidatus Magasanikbacteria bacterium]|nr:hypothetical protein [Candidatus Magasanikbacteria bacterium]
MTQQQKISLVALGVFAIAVITLGLLHINNGIVKPLAWQREKSNDGGLSQLQETLLKDTDSDGIVDYEELTKFRTSPYLPDTDGDGVKDGEEIKAGTDPNCATGATCTEVAETDVAGTDNKSTPGFVTPSPSSAPDAALDPAALQQFLGGENVTPDLVRKLLAEAGADPKLLEGIDEQTLMQVYAKAVTQMNGENTEAGGAVSVTTTNE